MTTSLIVVVGILVAGVIGTFVLSFTASRPSGLGVKEGRLAEAPASPNCVSTQTADRSHWIEPIAFEIDSSAAMKVLTRVVNEFPGSTIIEQDGNYLYAEFRSRLFRFVDDVEFLIEPESNRIHFRSAARVGHSDLGANRKRMEQIRTMFEAAAQPRGAANSPYASEPVISK